MTPKHYSVYCLLEDGCHVRYFGITRQPPNRRFLAHMAEAKKASSSSHKNNWIRKCSEEGKSVSIKVLKSNITRSRACRIEKLLIALFISAFRLVNYLEGGETGTPARNKTLATISCDGIMGSDVIELRGTAKKQAAYKLYFNGSLSRKRITERGIIRLLAGMVYRRIK